MKKFNSISKLLIAQFFTIVIILILIEVIGKIYAFYNPGHETLYAVPDEFIGWRMTPNLEYTHTGSNWYQNEFKVQIKHNSLGFRDHDRSILKPNGIKRIALLGYSSVSARQVEFKNTPGQKLESLLNQNLKGNENKSFEVLNFGIDGIGVGQSYLTYIKYAKRYNPDYIFLFVFEGDIWRTIAPLSAITDNIDSVKSLIVRPIFNMTSKSDNFQSPLTVLNFSPFYKYLVDQNIHHSKSGNFTTPTEKEYLHLINSLKNLITKNKITEISQVLNKLDLKLYPPTKQIYEKFVFLQQDRIKNYFGEDRTRIREHKVFLMNLFHQIKLGLKNLNAKLHPELIMKNELKMLIKTFTPRITDNLFSGSINFPNYESAIYVNLKVLEVLNQNITNSGTKFIIVDASSHIIKHGRLPGYLLSEILKKYCMVNGIGYIPLSDSLNESKKNGMETRWPIDGHLNENGYRIFGEAMFEWIKNNQN